MITKVPSLKIVAAGLLLLTAALSSCVTSHIIPSAEERSAVPSAPLSLASIAQPLSNHTDVTARMSVLASYGDKQLPLKGNLRMRRGEVIQVAFTAMGMVEIARVELTPKKAYLIDRVSKQYAEASFKDLPAVGDYLNYSLIEALLWNELFLPGQDDISSALSQFTTENKGSSLLIVPQKQQELKCQFTADNDYRHLRQARLQFGKWVSTWDYAAYQRIDAESFPASITATLEREQQRASAEFTFTNIAFDDTSWLPRTNISNYSQVSLDDFLSRLSFLK